MTELNPNKIVQPEIKTSLAHAHALGNLMVGNMLHSEFEPSDAERVFQSGNLLVRAVDSPRLSSDGSGGFELNFDDVNREVDDLAGRGDRHGLWYASSTLLLPGKRIPTYKNFGFMFNGATADLHHIHDQDSGSSGQGDDFRASASELTSLAELADVIDDKNPKMNEVNATFTAHDLTGVFALEAWRPIAKINAWYMKQQIQQRNGFNLPMYVYDVDAGDITRWQPAREEIQEMIGSSLTARNPMKELYERQLGSKM